MSWLGISVKGKRSKEKKANAYAKAGRNAARKLRKSKLL